MAELYGTEEIFLGDFVSAAWTIITPSSVLAMTMSMPPDSWLRWRGGIDDVLAVLIAADTHGGDVLGERDIGNG